VTVTASSTLAEVAAAVSGALKRAGIAAVLTGGACAAVYSEGAYQSADLDFVIRGKGTRHSLDAALASIGFVRRGDRYLHPQSAFFVEFPRGPLAIGDDFDIRPVDVKLRTGSVVALSPTDACRDRLAAFYHWSDRQSLGAAVEIARRRRVNRDVIRRWSRREGHRTKCQEFLDELKPRRRRRAPFSRDSRTKDLRTGG
jgi:hypothetical protein